MCDSFKAYRVEKIDKEFLCSVKTLSINDLPPGDVTISCAYSSLNYKDALSTIGNPGVTKNYPHTPGIDAAGVVNISDDRRFKPGDKVIVTSYDLGMNTAGGFGGMIRVPGDWVVPLPKGLSLREAMVLGTGGLTAGIAAKDILRAGVTPKTGPVIITGASGGVGSLAVALMAKLGFEVHASTGTAAAKPLLEKAGASKIISRQELSQTEDKPLFAGRWGCAIDVVGGATLENVIKSIKPYGAVAICGLVGGSSFKTNVFPFILRGITLTGVESGEYQMKERLDVWEKLGGPWKTDFPDEGIKEVSLDRLDIEVKNILEGKTCGQILVNLES